MTLLTVRRRAGALLMGLLMGILGASLLALSGCGYALVGRASNLPADIKNVYIRPLENRTPRSQVEQALTRAIADEMVQRQRFAVLGSPEGADAELSGAVVGYGATPVTFDQSGRATEYEIMLTAQIAFKRIGQDQPIWSNDRYTFRETYPIEATNENYVDLEDDAIERAAESFAETMVSDLLEGF